MASPTKISLDPSFSPYIMPVTIIGSMVNGRPNYMECTWISRINRHPPLWIISVNVKHLSLGAIQYEGFFSINFPSGDMVKVTDYVGLNSGRTIDKTRLFSTFSGNTGAPLITACPINIDCEVREILKFADHYLIIGEALRVYATASLIDKVESEAITLDMARLHPLIYTNTPHQPTYWNLGPNYAPAFHIGQNYDSKENDRTRKSE